MNRTTRCRLVVCSEIPPCFAVTCSLSCFLLSQPLAAVLVHRCGALERPADDFVLVFDLDLIIASL